MREPLETVGQCVPAGSEMSRWCCPGAVSATCRRTLFGQPMSHLEVIEVHLVLSPSPTGNAGMGLRASVLITHTVLESVFSDGRRWQAPVAREPFLERRVSPSVRRTVLVRRLFVDLRPRRPHEAIQRTASRLPRKGEALSCHRVQPVTSLVEARPHCHCLDGVERAARNVVSQRPTRAWSCSGQGRTGKQLVANRLHSQSNRVDNLPGNRLLATGAGSLTGMPPSQGSPTSRRGYRPSIPDEGNIHAPDSLTSAYRAFFTRGPPGERPLLDGRAATAQALLGTPGLRDGSRDGTVDGRSCGSQGSRWTRSRRWCAGARLAVAGGAG